MSYLFRFLTLMSDIDVQGNLILEHFVDDQMLAEEGILLTCEDMRNIFQYKIYSE